LSGRTVKMCEKYYNQLIHWFWFTISYLFLEYIHKFFGEMFEKLEKKCIQIYSKELEIEDRLIIHFLQMFCSFATKAKPLINGIIEVTQQIISTDKS